MRERELFFFFIKNSIYPLREHHENSIFRIFIFLWYLKHMTSRDRKVVDFTRSRVKTKSKLTNLMKLTRIEGYNGK